jgi:transposase-like protein
VYKTANVLNKVPKSIQSQVKHDLREDWTAPDRTTAEKASDIFAEKYGPKDDKAVQCLVRDRDRLPAFFDSPTCSVVQITPVRTFAPNAVNGQS